MTSEIFFKLLSLTFTSCGLTNGHQCSGIPRLVQFLEFGSHFVNKLWPWISVVRVFCVVFEQDFLVNRKRSFNVAWISSGDVSNCEFETILWNCSGYFSRNTIGMVTDKNGNRSSSFPCEVSRKALPRQPWFPRITSTVFFNSFFFFRNRSNGLSACLAVFKFHLVNAEFNMMANFGLLR